MAQKKMPGGLKVMFSTNLGKYFQEGAVWLYRKSKGKLGGSMQGAPVLLLTTRGRKTGKQRTTPLIYLRDGRDLVVVASKGGWPDDPLWYRNLQAEASVQVETGSDRHTMTARTASDDERARLWPTLVAMFPDYAKYQSWSDRRIPVVVLSGA